MSTRQYLQSDHLEREKKTASNWGTNEESRECLVLGRVVKRPALKGSSLENAAVVLSFMSYAVQYSAEN